MCTCQYLEPFTRVRCADVLIETTWIINRYFCFQKIEKPQILVLKESSFSNKKTTNLMSNEIAENENQPNFMPMISCETTVFADIYC